MTAAKRMILASCLVVVAMAHASALCRPASENRVWEKISPSLESRPVNAAQDFGWHQDETVLRFQLASEQTYPVNRLDPDGRLQSKFSANIEQGYGISQSADLALGDTFQDAAVSSGYAPFAYAAGLGNLAVHDFTGPSSQMLAQGGINFGLSNYSAYNNAYSRFSAADAGVINEDGTAPSPGFQALGYLTLYDAPVAGAGYRSLGSYYNPFSDSVMNPTTSQQLGSAGTALTQYSTLGLAGAGLAFAAEGAGVLANQAAGQSAEALAKAELEAQGNTIIGSQVTARTSGGIRYIDHLVQTPEGDIFAVEVKSGGAVRNASQLMKDELMFNEGATLGNNAGVLEGQTLNIDTVEMHY